MDITKILEDYKGKTELRKEGNEYYLVFPFFQRYSTDSVRIKFYEEDDSLFVSDCGDTAEYLENRYINLEDHREKLDAIKKRFYLKETDKHEFVLEFPSDQVLSIEMFFGFFIQALSNIANIDL